MENNVKNLSQVKKADIKILKGTVFDVFGGLPQSFIGISGEAGSGKSQVIIRLVSDISRKSLKVLVVLTEQSPSRWKALLDGRFSYDSQNVDVIYKGFIDDAFLKDLRKSPYHVIVFDSISGAVQEQKARQIAKTIRSLSEFYGKWVIGVLQVRGDNARVAGGEGVEHMIEVSYEITHFQLKPQNKWLYQRLEKHGYQVGDYVRLIRNSFDKIRGVKQKNLVVLNISEKGVDFIVLGKIDC